MCGLFTPHAYDACGKSWKEHCLRYPPLAVLGPPHTQRMCVETRVGTWPICPIHVLCMYGPFPFVIHGLRMLRAPLFLSVSHGSPLSGVHPGLPKG